VNDERREGLANGENVRNIKTGGDPKPSLNSLSHY
jgi:hypothetical protein